MTTFSEEMEAALAAGEPNLDNVGNGTVDGPGTCTCPALPVEHQEDECWGLPVVPRRRPVGDRTDAHREVTR